MKLTNDQVAEVVADASKKMSDPNYSAVMVGGFVQSQTPAAQFIGAHDQELGGAEAVVNVIFHCALVSACFQRGGGRSPRTLSYEDLDFAARGKPIEKLAKLQPAIADFINTNLEHPAAQQLVAMIAVAFDASS
ncbi:MAG: hypothetical protein R3B48_30475 [Kofleriaceae bacterium]